MNSLNTLRRLWMYAFLLLFSNYLVGQTANYVPNQLLIKFKPNIANTLAANTMQAVDATVIDNFENLSIQQWEVPDVVSINSTTSFSNLENLAEYLVENNSSIEFAEPNYYMSSSPTDFIPDDPFFTQLWALNNFAQTGGTADADIDAVEAWGETTGSEDIIVGVLDSGIDWGHPDLISNIWRNMGEDADGDGQILIEVDGQWVFDPDDMNGIDDDGNGYIDDFIGWDFVDEDNNPDDLNSHGTHVAGTIGAAGNNGTGIVGVTHSVRLMPLRFLNSDGVGAVSDAVKGLNYAISKGVHLTNNSWGSTGFSQSLRDAIEQAAEVNQLFIVAAGNNATNNDVIPNYPSNFDLDNIISVIATDENDQVAGFSNYGAESADLAAPGVGIFSTLPDATYGSANGTSMAAPHVTGAAVLLLAEDPEATYSKIKGAILGSVDVLDNLSGLVNTSGRLNVHNAVLAMQDCTTVSDFNPPIGTICKDDLQTFENISTDGISYEWYVDGEFVTNDENAKIIFTEYGDHEVKLIAVGEGEDCSSEITKTVYVTEPADAGFTYNTGSLEVTFEANEVSEDYAYLWSFDDGNGSATESSATHTFPAAGIYIVTLQVTNACGEISFVVEESVEVEESALPDCPTMDDIDIGAGGVTFDICNSAEGNSVNLGSNSPAIGGDFAENAFVVWSQAADDPIQVEIGEDNGVILEQHEACDVGTYHFFSTIYCSAGEDVSLDGNTVTYMVYPTPNAPIVTQNEEDECQYLIAPTCDFETVSEESITVTPGEEAGTREINVSNPGCINVYPVDYEACSVEVVEGCPVQLDITPGTPEITGCSNMLSLPFIAIQGENAANAVVVWSLAGDPDFEIEEGQVPIITLPENTDCEAKDYFFRADIVCSADGTILSGGEHKYTYFPRPQAPTIVRADDECNYTIDKSCPNDEVVMNPEDLVQEPGTEGGILIVEVSNGCGTPYTYPVAFEACPPACPTEEEVTIVENYTPVCNSTEGNVVELPEISVVGEAAENAVIVWKVVSPEGAAIEIPEGATSVELPQNNECEHVLYKFEATVFCSKNESVELYGGYADYEVHSAPQAPTIEQVQDEATGTCSYTVNPHCENDTVTPVELEDVPHNTPEGLATFEVSNAGCEAVIFELVVEECSTVCVLEEEFERIEEEKSICNLEEEGNAIVFPGLNVESENAESIVLTWTQLDNGAPMLEIVDGAVVLEQNKSCEVVAYEFVLTVGCSKDESISYDGGQVSYLLYPAPQAPTIERSNSEELEAEVCSYIVVAACEGDELSETEFTQEDGSGENLRDITVSNGGCEEMFKVEYEECPALPCAWKIAENTVKCNAPSYTMCIEAVDSLTDVIGINFNLTYPEGVVLADAEPSDYFKPSEDLVGDISNVSSFSNIAPDGSLNVVIFLGNITENTFNGVGTLGCVEFHFVEEMHNAWPEAAFGINSFQQSYLLETKEMCVDDGLLTIDFDPGHELSFMVRGDETRPLTDDATTPITSIYSADDTCSPSNDENALLDENGSAIVGSTDYFKATRWVGCEPLNPVVNGEDALLTAMIVARDASYTPNIYSLVAADVNENGIVDGGDVSLILARSVGAICSYPMQADKDTSDWVFERQEVATEDSTWMIDPAYPYGTGEGADANNVPLVAQCHFTPEPLGDTCAYTFSNYVAILKGDVDDTWNQDFAMMAEAPGKLVIDFNDMAASIDDKYYIPVYYNGDKPINAVDFRLSINTDELDVEEVRLASNNNGLKINYAWNQYENDILLSAYTLDYQIKAGKPVFYIVTNTHPDAISSNSVSASGAMLNGIPSGIALVGDVFTDIDHIAADTYQLRAYPNPADHSLNLSFSQEYGIEEVTYTVFDFTGKQLQQHTTTDTTTEIKTTELAAGTYLVTVQNSANGEFLAREKVLIVH